VQLRVSDLAIESDDKRYPYKSTGKREAHDPIRLDKGNVYKGQLHYVAEFVPALALRGVKFEHNPNELERAMDDEDGEEAVEGVSLFFSDPEDQAVPEGITTTAPVGAPPKKVSCDNVGSVDTVNTAPLKTTPDNSSAEKTEVDEPKEEQGVEMAKAELLEERTYGFFTEGTN
jgi:hypothetical protein